MQKGRFLCTKKPFSSGLKKLVAGGTHLRDNLADGSDNCFRLFVRDAETGIRNNYLSASRGEVRQLRLQLMDPNLEKYGSLFCLSQNPRFSRWNFSA